MSYIYIRKTFTYQNHQFTPGVWVVEDWFADQTSAWITEKRARNATGDEITAYEAHQNEGDGSGGGPDVIQSLGEATTENVLSADALNTALNQRLPVDPQELGDFFQSLDYLSPANSPDDSKLLFRSGDDGKVYISSLRDAFSSLAGGIAAYTVDSLPDPSSFTPGAIVAITDALFGVSGFGEEPTGGGSTVQLVTVNAGVWVVVGGSGVAPVSIGDPAGNVNHTYVGVIDDLREIRIQAAKQLKIGDEAGEGDKSAYFIIDSDLGEIFQAGYYTKFRNISVDNLPAPTSLIRGSEAWVFDASGPITGNPVVGAGGSLAKVWCDGSNWVVVTSPGAPPPGLVTLATATVDLSDEDWQDAFTVPTGYIAFPVGIVIRSVSGDEDQFSNVSCFGINLTEHGQGGAIIKSGDPSTIQAHGGYRAVFGTNPDNESDTAHGNKGYPGGTVLSFLCDGVTSESVQCKADIFGYLVAA